MDGNGWQDGRGEGGSCEMHWDALRCQLGTTRHEAVLISLRMSAAGKDAKGSKDAKDAKDGKTGKGKAKGRQLSKSRMSCVAMSLDTSS